MLTTNDKEDIHISYLSAVCASASISFDLQRHDDDSTDGIMKKLITLDDGTKYMSSLRIQLKCTSSVSQYTDDEEILHYKLKVKNFNDLCTRCTTPIILGLLVLPEDEDTWVKWSEKDFNIFLFGFILHPTGIFKVSYYSMRIYLFCQVHEIN